VVLTAARRVVFSALQRVSGGTGLPVASHGLLASAVAGAGIGTWLLVSATDEVISGSALPVETSHRVAKSDARMCMAHVVIPCDSRRMLIEDLGYADVASRTGHAPSRVRTMLQLLRDQLQQKQAASWVYKLHGGSNSSGSDLILIIDEALAEWNTLDDLILQQKLQRQRIASLLTACVEFFVAIHGQVLLINRKKRPKRTAAQKLLMGAKVRETRRLRGTLGKRQKQKLKGNAEGLTVTVTQPSARGRR
jgi:hypothetical protein